MITGDAPGLTVLFDYMTTLAGVPYLRRYPDRGLHGRAVDDLGLRIIRGEFPPGESLDLVQLGERYDASRGGVREVLRVLAGKGLIDARPKRGTFVRERSAWNLLDPDVLRWQLIALPNPELLEKLAEIRIMIEPAAAALAAERRTEDDLREMETALEIMDVDDEAADSAASIVAGDVRFHGAIILGTHNELIEQLSSVIEIGLRSRDEYVHGNHISIKNGWHGHESVVRAIRDRKPELARLSMLDLVQLAAADAREAVAREANARDASARRSQRTPSRTATSSSAWPTRRPRAVKPEE